jgi:hypothetical protein
MCGARRGLGCLSADERVWRGGGGQSPEGIRMRNLGVVKCSRSGAGGELVGWSSCRHGVQRRRLALRHWHARLARGGAGWPQDAHAWSRGWMVGQGQVGWPRPDGHLLGQGGRPGAHRSAPLQSGLVTAGLVTAGCCCCWLHPAQTHSVTSARGGAGLGPPRRATYKYAPPRRLITLSIDRCSPRAHTPSRPAALLAVTSAPAP